MSSEENLGVSINAELVRRLIAAQFPEWSNLPVTAIEPGGWDNRTFRLGDHMSVRLPSALAYVAQVEKEHEWLPSLALHLPLPIPVPLAKGAPAEGYPWPWSIYQWLNGDPVTTDHISDLTAFARSLARFLAALHSIDATGGPPAGQHNFHRGGRLAVYDAETRSALLALAGRMDIAVAGDIWTAALSSEWHGPPLWVHGDMSSGNLLMKDGDLCAVIDFGCAAVGDPACDLVIAWTLLSGESREAFRAALPLDKETWDRARGWALWKALITVADQNKSQQNNERSWQVIGELLADYRQKSDR
ncbi:aminoglycoside phosphotransferase family protein [Chelatococcus sp. GCM10030263]|uniref:aminoglycoside phosphotransferase family protein n=1 Tax=Chelatococcus sp. GCM10030263 TaxID=3273387 RepID=UPI003617F960